MLNTLSQIVTRQDRWHEIFQSWQQTSPLEVARDFLIVAGLILLIAGGAWLHRYWLRRRRFLGTFTALARELGLPWPDRWLLASIARHQGLPSPLTLLLSSATLAHHGRLYADALIPARRDGMIARIESLCVTVFGVT